MAIIFTSISRKQKTFRVIIILGLVLILFIIPFLVFTPLLTDKSKNIFMDEIPGSNVKINFNIIDSEEVKNLESFPPLQMEFSYRALDKNNKKVVGKIFATNKDNALNILTKDGFKDINLEEINIGKKEPFIPYY